MNYHVRHSTTLSYPAPVALAKFNLRLVPAPWPGQTVGEYALRIVPPPSSREDLAGPYCVNTTRIGFQFPLEELEVISEVKVSVTGPPEPGAGPLLAEVRSEALAQRDISAISPAPYLFASRIAALNVEIGDWAAASLAADSGIVAAASALMNMIHREFTYKSGVTDSATPPLEAFHKRKGVCQDFAHIMIMALRAHGIPAGYASGYLRTDPPPGKPRLVGADAMHAWVNVWCGSEQGWVAFDPTNDCLAHEDHIQIGMGRDYADVAPIDGTFIGTDLQDMDTSVDVECSP